jgi:SAM-dependent methyltransferase
MTNIIKTGFLRENAIKEIPQSEIDTLLLKQQSFLDQYGDKISEKYKIKWPINKLHWWSRPAEYHFLLRSLDNLNVDGMDILEFGPGCSFATHEVLTKMTVGTLSLVDNDNEVLKFWNLVAEENDADLFAAPNLRSFENKAFDLIYSVSVLEHVDGFKQHMNELISLLRPGGWLVLTMDIDLSDTGDNGLNRSDLEWLILNDRLILPPNIRLVDIYPKDLLKPNETWRNNLFNENLSFLSKVKRKAYKLINFRTFRRKQKICVFNLVLQKK